MAGAPLRLFASVSLLPEPPTASPPPLVLLPLLPEYFALLELLLPPRLLLPLLLLLLPWPNMGSSEPLAAANSRRLLLLLLLLLDARDLPPPQPPACSPPVGVESADGEAAAVACDDDKDDAVLLRGRGAAAEPVPVAVELPLRWRGAAGGDTSESDPMSNAGGVRAPSGKSSSCDSPSSMSPVNAELCPLDDGAEAAPAVTEELRRRALEVTVPVPTAASAKDAEGGADESAVVVASFPPTARAACKAAAAGEPAA